MLNITLLYIEEDETTSQQMVNINRNSIKHRSKMFQKSVKTELKNRCLKKSPKSHQKGAKILSKSVPNRATIASETIFQQMMKK